jgi:hypothetical protein
MRIVKISCAVVFISSLSACSYFSEKKNADSSSTSTPEEVSLSETVIEEEPVAPVTISENIQQPIMKPAEAKVTLTQIQSDLKSKQIIDWHDTESGFVLFSWIPPKGSNCKPTTFPVKKYQDLHSLTYTKRSIYDANHKACNGLWTVEVTEKPNKILATASVKVGSINSRPEKVI